MIPHPFGGRVCRAVLAIAAMVPSAAPAAPAAVATACASVAPFTATTPPPTFDELRAAFERARAEPDRALAFACAETTVARGREAPRAWIDVAVALVNRSRAADAVRILNAVIDGQDGVRDLAPSLLADAYAARGKAALELHSLDVAERDLQEARRLQLAEGSGRSLSGARTLVGLANVRHEAVRLDEADRAVDEADAILRSLGLSGTRDAADVLAQRSMIAFARQDLAGTLRLATAEIDARRAIGGPDDAEQLDPLATVIAIRSMTGDFDGSVAAAREALRIFDLHPDASVENRLGVVQNLASTYMDRVRFADALPLAEDALRLSLEHYGKDSPANVRAYLTLGTIDQELARYPEALELYARAAAIVASNPEAIPVFRRLRLHLGRASLELRVGDVDAVKSELSQANALMADRPKLGYWRAWHAKLSCRVAALANDWSTADAECGRSIAENADVLSADNLYTVVAMAGRCIAQTRGHLPGDACERIDRRLRDGPRVDPRSRVLAVDALAERAPPDASLPLRIRAVVAAEETGAPDPLWAALHALATDLQGRGQRGLAIFFGKRSIEAIEQMRSHFDDDHRRLERGFLADKLAVYRDVADWLLAADRVPEAIEVLRLLKREEVHDFNERADVEAASTRVPYSAREEAYAAALDRLSGDAARAAATARASATDEIERLSARREAKDFGADERARLAALLAAAERSESARAGDVARFIAEERAASDPVTGRTPAPRVDRPLARDEADVYYFVAGSRLNVVFAWKDGFERIVVPIQPAALQRRVGEYLAALSSRNADVAGSGAELYEWLGRPLDVRARAHGIRRVHLWLDGLLRYVPFAALWDGRSFLVDRYEFSYRFAAAAPADPRIAHVVRSPTLVAFGVTQAMGGMPALPGVGDELCGIVDGPVSGLAADEADCASSGVAHGTIRGLGFANAFFTEQRLRAAAANADSAHDARLAHIDHLHIGTHFSLRPGNVQRSWLLLGTGERLQLAILRDFDFSDIDLVTLSACQTGMAGGVGDDGREIEGLPALIHRRGAKAVVATLWRIEDRSASALMRGFYDHLRQADASVPAALRRAQLAMLHGADASRTRPYYWAAFIPSSAGR